MGDCASPDSLTQRDTAVPNSLTMGEDLPPYRLAIGVEMKVARDCKSYPPKAGNGVMPHLKAHKCMLLGESRRWWIFWLVYWRKSGVLGRTPLGGIGSIPIWPANPNEGARFEPTLRGWQTVCGYRKPSIWAVLQGHHGGRETHHAAGFESRTVHQF